MKPFRNENLALTSPFNLQGVKFMFSFLFGVKKLLEEAIASQLDCRNPHN
jgi:hypothetical protein